MSTRMLVTGGAGFVGSHLVDHLVEQGHSVTVFDDLSTGSIANLAHASRLGEVRFIKGSVVEAEALAKAVEGCDIVFHLAVQCVRRSLEYPIENHEANATGTLLALECARRAAVKRFVYCSSSEVYGNATDAIMNEETTVCRPTTVYGAAKLAGEHYTNAYRCTYDLPTMVVRPFNAYGPRAHLSGELAEVIPRFAIQLRNGLPPSIFGSGHNGRDFTYVTDVAAGLYSASRCDALVGRTVNIAHGHLTSVREIARLLAEIYGRADLLPTYEVPRPGDVAQLHADTALAHGLFGYRASIALPDGLRRFVEWFEDNHPDPTPLLEPSQVNWRMPSDHPSCGG
jgi:UDP-glucose 4-epimerase